MFLIRDLSASFFSVHRTAFSKGVWGFHDYPFVSVHTLDIQLIPLSTSLLSAFFLFFLLRLVVAVGSCGLTSWRAMSKDRLEAQPMNICLFFFCLQRHSKVLLNPCKINHVISFVYRSEGH